MTTKKNVAKKHSIWPCRAFPGPGRPGRAGDGRAGVGGRVGRAAVLLFRLHVPNYRKSNDSRQQSNANNFACDSDGPKKNLSLTPHGWLPTESNAGVNGPTITSPTLHGYQLNQMPDGPTMTTFTPHSYTN